MVLTDTNKRLMALDKQKASHCLVKLLDLNVLFHKHLLDVNALHSVWAVASCHYVLTKHNKACALKGSLKIKSINSEIELCSLDTQNLDESISLSDGGSYLGLQTVTCNFYGYTQEFILPDEVDSAEFLSICLHRYIIIESR